MSVSTLGAFTPGFTFLESKKMVKADAKCDYYADLELPPSCDTNEVKKQFKKLGFTAPVQVNRNPGRELEFNSKFQAIQAAHEVLTDPTQRAKYDADRMRNGMVHTYPSPSRPNPPPRAAASNFPPPPQRTPQASSRTNYATSGSSGAGRYSAYMRTDPNNSYKSPADDAKARANAFKAWEQMRHVQGVPPQARPVPPRPTKNPGYQTAREAGSFPPQEPSQRTPWDQTKEPHAGFPKMARSNTTRVPKKGGFAPGFSGGDEPPARHTSAYCNVSKGEKPDISRSNFESRPAPPPPSTSASTDQRGSQKRPDPLKPFRPKSATEDNFTNSERLSTPYATSGGEKTYFSTGFGRPSSAREGTSAGDVYDSEPLDKGPNPVNASNTSQRGHRSASPKLRKPRPVSISSTSSSSSDESLREGVEQLYTSAGQAHGPQNPPQNSHLRPSYRPFVGVEDVERDKDYPPRSRSDASGQQTQSGPPKIDPGQTEGFMEHRMKHEAERTHSVKEPKPLGSYMSNASSPQQRPLHRPKSWHDKYGAAGQDQVKDSYGRPATGDQPAKPSMFTYDSFTIPPETKTNHPHPPPLRSHSSDTISVNFSPLDWHGKFTGRQAEGYFDPPTKKNQATRGRASPTKRQDPAKTQFQPTASTGGSKLQNGSSDMPPPPAPPSGNTQDDQYSPDKWAPYFQPGTLNWPPPPPPVGAPARGASRKRPITPSRRASRTVFKRAAVPKPASVAPAVSDETSDETNSSTQESGSSQGSGNGTPMDLDIGSSPSNGADVANSQRASNHVDGRDTTPRPPIPPRATIPPRKPTPRDSHLGLGELKNVAPFVPNEEGIKDLNDLNTSLPFESKASSQATKPPSPQKLALPRPPKPPLAPEKLTQSSWEHYISAMRAYMTAWNLYNTQILAHFNERQASQGSVFKPEWMSAIGEGTEKWGYGKYMQGVEEDFQVRQHWDVSCERHRDCMKVLGTVREKLLGTTIRVAG
ncbi:MAG: hypothetical protein Q9209_000076 [Squamulea sp. 1 TL-2023]